MPATPAEWFRKLSENRPKRETPPDLPAHLTYVNLRKSMTCRHEDGKLIYRATGNPVTTAYPAHIRRPLGLPNILQHYCRLIENDPTSMLLPTAVILQCYDTGDLRPMHRWYEYPVGGLAIPMQVWAVASLHIDHQLPIDQIANIFSLSTKGRGLQYVQGCVDYALACIPSWYLREAARVHDDAPAVISKATADYDAAMREANTKAHALMQAHPSNVRPRTLSAALTIARAGMGDLPLPKLGEAYASSPHEMLLDALLDLQDSLPPPPPASVADLPGAYPMLAWYSSCTRAAP